MNCISLVFAFCQIVAVVLFGTSIPQTQPQQPTNNSIYSFNTTNIINNNNNVTIINEKFTNFTLGEAYSYPSIYHITVKENVPTRGLDTAVTVFGSFGFSDKVLLVKGTKTLNCTIISSNRKASCPIPAGTGTSQFRVDILSHNHAIVSLTHTFQYAHPVIHKVIQSTPSPTNGNLLVTIIGTNFGSNSHKVVSVFVGNSHKVFGSPQCLNAKCSKESITFFTPPGFGENGNFVVVSVNGLTSQPSGQTVSYAVPIIHSVSPVFLTYSGIITLIGENFAVSSFDLNTTISIGEAKCVNVAKYFDHDNEVITCLIDYHAEDLNSVSITIISNDNQTFSAKGTDFLYMLEISLITTDYPLIGHYTLIYVAPFPSWLGFPFVDFETEIESLIRKVTVYNLFVMALILINLLFRKIHLLLTQVSRVPLDIDIKALSQGLNADDVLVYKQHSRYRFLRFMEKEVQVVKLTQQNKSCNVEAENLFKLVEAYLHNQNPHIVVNEISVIFNDALVKKFQHKEESLNSKLSNINAFNDNTQSFIQREYLSYLSKSNYLTENDGSNTMLACQSILSNHENLSVVSKDIFLNGYHSNSSYLSPHARFTSLVNYALKYSKHTLLLSWVSLGKVYANTCVNRADIPQGYDSHYTLLGEKMKSPKNILINESIEGIEGGLTHCIDSQNIVGDEISVADESQVLPQFFVTVTICDKGKEKVNQDESNKEKENQKGTRKGTKKGTRKAKAKRGKHVLAK